MTRTRTRIRIGVNTEDTEDDTLNPTPERNNITEDGADMEEEETTATRMTAEDREEGTEEKRTATDPEKFISENGITMEMETTTRVVEEVGTTGDEFIRKLDDFTVKLQEPLEHSRQELHSLEELLT
jgi:hypothetical protein